MGLRPPRSACTDSYFAEPTLVRAYEGGANRVGAGRLFDLSRVLDVPVGFFFDEMPAAVAASSPAQLPGSAQPLPEQELDPMVKRETLELVRAYYKIGESGVRKRLFEMTKALAAASSGTAPTTEARPEGHTHELQALMRIS